MATDRDRYARVLDKRFEKVGYLLDTGSPEFVARMADYIEMREREADPDLAPFFREAVRVATRADVPLPLGVDMEAARIRELGVRSHPASRLAAAFEDVLRSGDHLAAALASRQVRWLQGCLQTQRDWPHLRALFPARAAELADELGRRHRAKYLGLGDRPQRRNRVDQRALMSEKIPLR